MELSLFLAKLFGIYLLSMAALLLFRGSVVASVIEEMFANRSMLFLSGLMALLVGIAMAISHSVWELNWRGVITLFGYLSIVKGVARIAFPETVHQLAGPIFSLKGRGVLIGMMLAIGGYLTWAGFTQS